MTSFCTRVSLVSVRFRADVSLGRGRQCACAAYSLPDCGPGTCQATGAALLLVSVGISPPLLLMNQPGVESPLWAEADAVPRVELARFVGGKRTWAGEESLQTELQTDHAAQHAPGITNQDHRSRNSERAGPFLKAPASNLAKLLSPVRREAQPYAVLSSTLMARDTR
jgi:hypothetical protein